MPLSPGMRLGPYEILERIGQGGMGEVYRALDTRLERIVCHQGIQRTIYKPVSTEARVIAALNHSNICQLYDVGPNYLGNAVRNRARNF